MELLSYVLMAWHRGNFIISF